MKKNLWILTISLVLAITACTNPFAPGVADDNQQGSILGDQRTVDGLFKNFRYAYLFKDTTVYGNLLADDFRFIYRNYEKEIDDSWGRDEEMVTTSRLFMASKSIDLTWNDVTNSVGDSLLMDISRGFNLTIFFSANDVINIFGRVNMRIARKSTDDIWKITIWRDESNF